MKTIVFLLDETGSMHPHKAETIASFNKYLEETKKAETAEEPIYFHLTLFNSEKLEKRYVHEPIKDVYGLTSLTYVPDFSTPLYDAIGQTISPIMGEALMVILTDGMENASKEYSLPAVKALIEEREKAGWQFLYLGSTLDVAAAAMQMGMAAVTSTPTASVSHAMRTASLASGDYLKGKTLADAHQYASDAAKPEDSQPGKTWGGS